MVISMANPDVQNDGPSVELTDVTIEVGLSFHVVGNDDSASQLTHALC
jgi:hypothetical protein